MPKPGRESEVRATGISGAMMATIVQGGTFGTAMWNLSRELPIQWESIQWESPIGSEETFKNDRLSRALAETRKDTRKSTAPVVIKEPEILRTLRTTRAFE
jgi:hypothetical protein